MERILTDSTFYNETPLITHTQLSHVVTQPNVLHYCIFNFGPLLSL